MNMMDAIKLYREAMCNLWNHYMMNCADWNTVEVYESICLQIFDEIISSRIGDGIRPIPVTAQAVEPVYPYKVKLRGEKAVNIAINRNIPPSGYWDYPIDSIESTQNIEMAPISFFDWDILGWRYFEYIRVRITSCQKHPQIIGRDALIELEKIEIELSGG